MCSLQRDLKVEHLCPVCNAYLDTKGRKDSYAHLLVEVEVVKAVLGATTHGLGHALEGKLVVQLLNVLGDTGLDALGDPLGWRGDEGDAALPPGSPLLCL